jgi:hypothetical protein
MSEQPHADAAEGLAGLETALRDAAARARKPDMPLLLVLGFFSCVASLSRCLRVYRRDAGLPRGLGPELVFLLNTVRNSACQRLSDPALTEKTALQLSRSIDALARAASLALPPPVRTRKAPDLKPAAVAAPAKPQPRRADLSNLGVHNILNLHDNTYRDAMIADAVRLAIRKKLAA